MGKLYFKTFSNVTEEEAKEITTLFTESFISMNKIWQKLKVPYEQVFDLMSKRVKAAVDYGIITVAGLIFVGSDQP